MAIKKLNKLIPDNDICIKGSVELSSDKSLSIRSILFASIAYGISHIKIKNPGEDAVTAIMAIKKLGIKVIKNNRSIYYLWSWYWLSNQIKKIAD